MNIDRMRMAVIAGLAAAAVAVGSAGTASAADEEWDFGEFETCKGSVDQWYLDDVITSDQHTEYLKMCCDESGGDWMPPDAHHPLSHCVAPVPLKGQESGAQVTPGEVFDPVTPLRPGQVVVKPGPGAVLAP